MTRLGLMGLAVVLVLAGCTVPSLEELENEQPRACNAQHACGEGQACVSGFCVAFVCDAGTPTLGYVDADRDGHGAVDAEAKAFCGSVPAGYAAVRGDCDDSQASVYPGAREDCDGLDNNCTGGIDEGHARTEYFRDADGDLVGAGPAVQACRAPAGYVTSSGDCDDVNPDRAPSRSEVCNDVDDDCDGEMDEGFDKNWYLDGDNDTYGRNEAATVSCASPGANYVKRSGDCDDSFAAVNPGATELCNNRDDNCSGIADETFPDKGMPCTDGNSCAGVYECNAAQTATFCKAPDRIPYYADRDMDGQGVEGSTAVLACVEAPVPSGTATNATDCDDADADTYVGATE
ncbi:putative metal-binding motif-containing protein, partial [Pyxidicoccus sp. 3LG]